MRREVNKAGSVRRESTTDATRPCDLTGKNPHDPQGHWRVSAPIRTSLALRSAKQTTGLRTHVCAEKCTQQSISCANGSNFRERKFEGFSQESLHKKTRTADAVLVFWSGLRGSNPPPRPWQGRALPNELNPQMVPPVGIEPTTRGFSVPCSTN